MITLWILFSKAGRPGWGSIIPVYNSMLMADIAKKPQWMGILVGAGFLIAGIPLLGWMTGIAALVFMIIILIDFINQYDRGVGFWLAYLFLPIVAVFMVKKANYIGGQVAAVPLRPPFS